ncbi:MAG: hypothetical protein ABWZ82_04425 [Candidatus Limnocylindrales bacterium]
MVSFIPAHPSDRHVPGTGPIRTPERSAHARALPAPDDASLTLGRRIGVLVVLAALGGAIVLAATGGGSDRDPGVAVLPTTAPIATPTPMSDAAPTYLPVVGAPTGQPTFVAPKATLVNKRRIPLRVRVPEPGVPWDGLELRVLRGGTQVLTQAIGPDDLDSKGRVTLRNVRLKRGTNRLSVVFANATGVGPASDPIAIRMDDRPPKLKVTSPLVGATLNADSVTVKGRTVPGISAIVRNMVTNQKVVATADGTGRFGAEIGLKRGRNTLKVVVADAAGNQNPVQVAIVRGNGRAEARLALSRKRIRRSALPRPLGATVTVLDAEGRPIKNARVEFNFGPPGLPTQVRNATTSKLGVARSEMRLVEGAVADEGLVTVRVTLEDGRVLTDTAKFRVV